MVPFKKDFLSYFYLHVCGSVYTNVYHTSAMPTEAKVTDPLQLELQQIRALETKCWSSGRVAGALGLSHSDTQSVLLILESSLNLKLYTERKTKTSLGMENIVKKKITNT